MSSFKQATSRQLKRSSLRWLLPALLLLTMGRTYAQAIAPAHMAAHMSIPLHTGWRFHEVGKDAWYPATVPGCVHTDLLHNKLIGDPFYRANEQQLQWIGKTDWEYQTTFNVTPAILQHQNIELVFAGLDTYADVFLNDQSLLHADNMFRTWRVDCKPALRPGANTLRICFRSPINEVLPRMAKLDYQLPASNDQGEKTSPYTRKAPYQYGWDWGPRFVTSGIWRAVTLEAWDGARLSDLHIKQDELTHDKAQLTAEVEVVATQETDATLSVERVAKDHATVARAQVKLHAGVNQVALPYALLNPQLWWPNGLGAQSLYTFRARLLVGGVQL